MVWLFAGVVFSNTSTPAKPNLIIRNNVIDDNGFGVYLGWGGNWVTEITGNKIRDNGEGIRIVNSYTYLLNNLIENNITGIRVTAEHQGKKVTELKTVLLLQNAIIGNTFYGIENLSSFTVEAHKNWWGNAAGPIVPGQSTHNSADRIVGPVDYSDWLTAPLPGMPGARQPGGASSPPTTNGQAGSTLSPEGASVPSANIPLRYGSEFHFKILSVKLAMPYATALCMADFNGDGNLDLLLGTEYAREAFLWLGDGTGHFVLKSNFSCKVHPNRVYAYDVNGDGFLDVITLGRHGEGVTLLHGDSVGSFSITPVPLQMPPEFEISETSPIPPTGKWPFGLILADKSKNLILIYQWDKEHNRFREQTQLTISQPHSLAIGDFNSDGLVDIALLTGTQDVAVLWGEPGGWRTVPDLVYQSPTPLQALESADVDGNGATDIVLRDDGGNIITLLMDLKGKPTIRETNMKATKEPVRLQAADINGDGKADLILVMEDGRVLDLLRSLGDGFFESAGKLTTNCHYTVINVGDVNRDGVPDLVGLKANSNQVTLFLQEQ